MPAHATKKTTYILELDGKTAAALNQLIDEIEYQREDEDLIAMRDQFSLSTDEWIHVAQVCGALSNAGLVARKANLP